jgi:preprotein translocase subunit SecA
VNRFLRAFFSDPTDNAVALVNRLRAQPPDRQGDEGDDLPSVIAATALVAERTLGLRMFDVQIRGALAMANGSIAEMQTGEGKTLAAVPAVVWFAKSGLGVHVMTVNDYLARRDADWMGPVYTALGFSVGCVQQNSSVAERKAAYACDITYATANEIGFDYLRDQLALDPDDQVHRPFAAALIDEADSILIDEARIPLVIAGGAVGGDDLPVSADRVVRTLRRGFHFTIEDNFRNVSLTDAGIRTVERALACGNLYEDENSSWLSSVQDSLHAHALLRRDVDYIVRNGAVESVDEFKGRVAQDRRWPAGLHAALEIKEGVAPRTQGRILGSITLQNLIALYPRVCGMTGTAATQAGELKEIYGLAVEVIPPNRPVVRIDYPDEVFRTRRDKEQALLAEMRTFHQTGRPVLIGTASVAESERLSQLLADLPDAVPHQVLNARSEEREASLIALAGEKNAVTISTNMAGRGTDIRLGEGVAELGGLHVIGTDRHESRRIDFQLRGRAGRQGDPGSSRFIVSLEDDLVRRFADDADRLGYTPESVQRRVEGKNLDIRLFLGKYEGAIEGQRQMLQKRRQEILMNPEMPRFERTVALRTVDDLWSDHLAEVAELRSGVQWLAWGGRDPLHGFLTRTDTMFRDLLDRLDDEIALRTQNARETGIDPSERGATWTYLTTDNPFGSLTERIIKSVVNKLVV